MKRNKSEVVILVLMICNCFTFPVYALDPSLRSKQQEAPKTEVKPPVKKQVTFPLKRVRPVIMPRKISQPVIHKRNIPLVVQKEVSRPVIQRRDTQPVIQRRDNQPVVHRKVILPAKRKTVMVYKNTVPSGKTTTVENRILTVYKNKYPKGPPVNTNKSLIQPKIQEKQDEKITVIKPAPVVSTPQPETKPATSNTIADKDKITQAVNTYIEGWKEKDIDKMLSVCAPDFVGGDRLHLNEFKNLKLKEFGLTRNHTISIKDINVRFLDAENAITAFSQFYDSTYINEYAASSGQKGYSSSVINSLRLRKEDDSWLIYNESFNVLEINKK